ncbi:MAG: hypothetical protein N2171_04865 [Clostridia bacterium]|nr:hypothetical protein [Clostridia bacterium]
MSVLNAIESLYKGKMTVTEYHKTTDSTNKITSKKEVTTLTDQPCKLSFESVKSTTEGDAAASVTQSIKIFCSPTITIKPGSKIEVTQNGITTAYSNSGEPAVYSNHQEIRLELFKGWS